MSKQEYNPYYTQEELKAMNFKSLGENVLIDKRTPIDRPYKISIGDNVRIGSFCILSGDITIGSFVHIASYCFLNGSAGIEMKDFSGLSAYCCIISSGSDYSGESIVVPCVPEKYRNDTSTKIILEKHSVMGVDSLILPGGYLAEGVAVGAKSVIRKKTEPFGIYLGNPAKKIAERSRKMLELEKEFLAEFINGGGGLSFC